MKKNISGQIVSFRLLSTTDGSDVTTGTPTVYVTGDGGTQATGSGTCVHEGNGEWSYAPTQAETNYDHIAFSIKLSGAFSQTVNVYPTFPQTGDAYSAVGALNDVSSADVNAACDTALTDYGANTTTPPTVAQIRTEMDSNSTQLSAIITDTGTTIPSQITALNNVSSAEVNAACGTALTDYGANTTTPPTVTQIRAEIDSNSTQLSAILTDTGTTLPGQISTVDANVDSILVDTGTTIPAQITALNDVSSADVNTACDTALADYDGPTNTEMTTAFSDLQTHGDSNWGSSGENPNVLLVSEITSVTSQTEIVLTSGSDQDDAYNDQSIVLYDDTNSDYPSVRVITNYTGSTKTVEIDSAPDFTVGADDSVRIFVTAPGSTAPTASQVADAVWEEAIADHSTSTTFGGKNQNLVPSETLSDYKSDSTAANQTTMIGHLTDIKGSGFSDTTDSLEAIRDRGDAAWTTGSGGTPPTVVEIRTEMDSNSTQLAAIVSDTNELQTNQGNWATADVSALATSAALATVDTVVDAIKLKTDNLPTDPADQSAVESAITTAHATTDGEIAALNDFDPASDTVAHVTLVDTTTTNTDMVTDVAASVAAILADTNELQGNQSNWTTADLTAITADVSAILVDTGTTIPDLIAALNDPTSAAIATAILDSTLSDVAAGEVTAGQAITLSIGLRAVFNRFFREVVNTSTTQTVKNDSGTSIAAMTLAEVAGTSQTKGSA